jgi:hypothetical protein
MKETDVSAEIRAIRDELAARCGNDAWELARAMTERARAAGRTVVRLPPRPPAPPRATVGRTPAVEPAPSGTEAVA